MKRALFTFLALAGLVLPAVAQKPGEVMYVTPAEAAKLTSKVVDGVSTNFLVRKDA